MTEYDKIIARSGELEKWLNLQAPFVATENAHLNLDSRERAYWAFGYYLALQDIAALLRRRVDENAN